MYTSEEQMATRNPQKAGLTERWNFRVAEREDQFVRSAAAASELDFTSFVRNAAFVEAQRVLADRTSFVVDEVDWQTFSELLDRDPVVPAGLKHLFSKPSVLDR
jgi:uncharacterized protein (DUF1778 family)